MKYYDGASSHIDVPKIRPRKQRRVSFYQFDTLQEVIDFFAQIAEARDVKIGGAFGGSEPTEDDTPVFSWEARE